MGRSIISELAAHGAACIYGELASLSFNKLLCSSKQWLEDNENLVTRAVYVSLLLRPHRCAAQLVLHVVQKILQDAEHPPYKVDILVEGGERFPLITNMCATACSPSSDEDLSLILPELEKAHPNTTIIGYPLNVANEQDTLALIDEVLNNLGRLDVWVCSSGLLGPPSVDATTPAHLQKCFEANSMAPFFALKYAPPAMAKLATKGHYPNAAPKDQKYGSIVVVSSVASTYGGKQFLNWTLWS